MTGKIERFVEINLLIYLYYGRVTDFEGSVWILYLIYWHNQCFFLYTTVLKELSSHLKAHASLNRNPYLRTINSQQHSVSVGFFNVENIELCILSTSHITTLVTVLDILNLLYHLYILKKYLKA